MGGPPQQASGQRSSRRQAANTAARPTRSRPTAPVSAGKSSARTRPAASPVRPQAAAAAAPEPREGDPANDSPSDGGNIQFQLAGLQSTVQKSSQRVRILGALAAVLAIAFAAVLFYMRHSYIMQFAEVEQLEIIRSELHTGTAVVRFRPLTAGRIQFVRSGNGRQETLLEYASGPTPEGEFKEFHWTGDADGAWSINIRHREGGGLIDREWQSADWNRPEGGVLAVTPL